MRYVLINDVKPGMILGNELHDLQGRVVISAGCELTEPYIKRLKLFGYAGVYVTDDISEGIEIEPSISPDLRIMCMKQVKNCDIDSCMKIAKNIIEELMNKDHVALDMADLRSFDDYTYAHSVNVAVLCCALGIGMSLSEKDLDNLVIAALLHDIGKTMVPPDILNKPERLTKEEYQVMKSHSTFSYELLDSNYGISSQVKNAVLLHHENVDGTGYPKGLTGDELTDIVKILHVADVYDALVSNRPYKKGYAPWEAAEYLMGACGIMFDLKVVERFLQIIPLYPKGSEVTLSTGDKGIVVENYDEHNLRPIIRLLSDGRELDLMERQYQNITIVDTDRPKEEVNVDNEKKRQEMITEVPKKHILVVDDMLPNLHMLRGILMQDYEVTLLKSGEQAVTYLTKNHYPDLIIMDIDMPGMNGIEATKHINAMTGRAIPVLFVTAICNKETVLMCREVHAAGYIVRPYKSIYIISEIERILGRGVEI